MSGASAFHAHFTTAWDDVQVMYTLCILPVSYEGSETDYLSLIARFDPHLWSDVFHIQGYIHSREVQCRACRVAEGLQYALSCRQ
jgi:hypothetical protein